MILSKCASVAMRARCAARGGLFVALVVALVLSVPSVTSQETPPTRIDILLELPESLDPTIVTGTEEGSSSHRLVWLGPNALRLVNFDETVAFSFTQSESATSPILTVCNTGGTGDDPAGPWPRLQVDWTGDSAPDEPSLLDRDECASCENCGMKARWTLGDDTF